MLDRPFRPDRSKRTGVYTETNKMNQSQTSDSLVATSSAPLQLAAAALFGVLILFGVGFAPMAAAHNAAHDTRHSVAFPCH